MGSLVLDLINKGLSFQLTPTWGEEITQTARMTTEGAEVTPPWDNAFSCFWRSLLFPHWFLHPLRDQDPLSHQSAVPWASQVEAITLASTGRHFHPRGKGKTMCLLAIKLQATCLVFHLIITNI